MKQKSKPNKLVDIALLTCGLVEPQVFQDCVESLKKEGEGVANFQVFFNGLPPESRDLFSHIAYTMPNVLLRNTSERVGFPAGANRVIRMGNSPLVLFVTDDIILKEGTLKTLVNRMDDKTIALCGLKLLFPLSSTDKARPAGRVQHIGHGIDLHGEVTHPLLGWKPENKKCNNSRDVQSVTGGVFMVRRELFKRAGGFFEGYGLGYFEDVDLCLTLRQMGHRIFIDTNAVADHHTNSSMLKANQPIPMYQNKMLFQMRKGNVLVHDSWSFWALAGVATSWVLQNSHFFSNLI